MNNIIKQLHATDGVAILSVNGACGPIRILDLETSHERDGTYTARFNGEFLHPGDRTKKKFSSGFIPAIEKVIFNDPATIVFWADGTKTVVKAQNEDFDPEKGLAMAIAKKALGNQGNYCNEIKKWTEPYLEERSLIDEVISNVRQATAKLKHHVDQSNLRAARHFLKQARVPKTTKSVMVELIDDSIEILDKVLDE